MNERLKLWDDPDGKLINIKMTRGTNKIITKDEIIRELNRIYDDRKSGILKPTGPAKSSKPSVNIRDFVKEF